MMKFPLLTFFILPFLSIFSNLIHPEESTEKASFLFKTGRGDGWMLRCRQQSARHLTV